MLDGSDEVMGDLRRRAEATRLGACEESSDVDSSDVGEDDEPSDGVSETCDVVSELLVVIATTDTVPSAVATFLLFEALLPLALLALARFRPLPLPLEVEDWAAEILSSEARQVRRCCSAKRSSTAFQSRSSSSRLSPVVDEFFFDSVAGAGMTVGVKLNETDGTDAAPSIEVVLGSDAIALF